MICKDAVIGGMGRHVIELSRALAKRGVRVEIAAPRANGTELALDGCEVSRPRSFGRLWSTELAPGLVWEAVHAPADVLHVHLPSPLGVATLAAVAAIRINSRRHERAKRPRVVVTYHCDLDRMFGPLGHAYNFMTTRILHHANAIIVASDALRESPVLARHQLRVTTIPFGVDPERLPATNAARQHAERLRRAHLRGRGLVVFVGRLVYYKGLPVLLRAMRSVDASLLIVGTGRERPRLEAMARDLNLADRVFFAGEIPDDRDVLAHYLAADVVTLPSTSRGEAFGLVQVEAALLEKPVVSSRLPGVRSVNVDGVTGLTVPPGDEGALAAALNRLVGDRDLAARMGTAGRARALREYSADTMALRTMELYREVHASSTAAVNI